MKINEVWEFNQHMINEDQFVAVDEDEYWGAIGALKDNNLTLEKMLRYAIQDEYLARAEYTLVIAKFNVKRPFSNIVKSEQNHVDALLPLFPKHKFPVPIDDSDEHVKDPDTLKDALQIGVDGEIDNIAMYNKFLNEDIPNDARNVFTNLRDASEGHLKAFERNLKKY